MSPSMFFYSFNFTLHLQIFSLMKRLTYLHIFFICSFILYSCQKCKDCSCTQVASQSGMPDVTQTFEITDVCGEELEAMEQTTVITQTVGGITQEIEQTCDCY